MSDKVDELESRVNELRATVDGLVDELVETKKRVKDLESQVRDEDEEDEGESATPERRSKEEEDSDDSGTDIIVA